MRTSPDRVLHSFAELASIRVDHPEPQPVAKRAPNVWSVDTPAVMPPMLKPRHCVNRKLQGGEPPVPYRSANNWSNASRRSHEPFNSRSIKLEILQDLKNLQADSKPVYSVY